MRAVAAAFALALATVVSAQDQVIQVGAEGTTPGGIFQFIPNNITATEGSVITFNFTGAPGNHTVAQSSFTEPCQPIDGGFDSGFIFVPAGSTAPFPTWNLTVTNATKPIWFYCAQRIGATLGGGPHCFAGMVGSINAPSTGATFGSFQSAAEAAASNSTVPPGVPTPNLSGSGAQATAPPGPLTGNFSGAGVPTGSASASGNSSASTSGSSSGAPAPTTTGSSGAMANAVNAAFVVLSGVAGALML